MNDEEKEILIKVIKTAKKWLKENLRGNKWQK
jgi:hypothetical protein